MIKLAKPLNLITLSLVVFIGLTIAFHPSSFLEGYYNGFYQMQTPFETVAAFFGNISYHIINL